ncbi:hypothetical protein EVAR_80470_1 [Eumeta japonica]|uniref:Uncharacterized protein n=1 Tax=Eumeta variegata TaxID=151549 RepID=A0A4C1YP61_EUMVA|nr:hypothetical protein EVAR_80470_1 [Eumeta japonica]
MKQRSLAVFGLVDILVEYTLTVIGFQGLITELEAWKLYYKTLKRWVSPRPLVVTSKRLQNAATVSTVTCRCHAKVCLAVVTAITQKTLDEVLNPSDFPKKNAIILNDILAYDEGRGTEARQRSRLDLRFYQFEGLGPETSTMAEHSSRVRRHYNRDHVRNRQLNVSFEAWGELFNMIHRSNRSWL